MVVTNMLKSDILLTCTTPAVLERPLLLSALYMGIGRAVRGLHLKQSMSNIDAPYGMLEQELKGSG